MKNYYGTDATDYVNELTHYGVKGMKWGIRRYQNKDGSLTDAGKRRLAKSIKKEAKNTTYEARDKLKRDIYNDLTTNYKFKMDAHIANINAKRKVLDNTEYVSYYDSDQIDKDTAIAYNKTVDYFKKLDNGYLEEIIALNNGNTDNLNRYHDFRKVCDRFTDEEWTKGKEKFNNEHRESIEKYNKAYQEYVDACKSATEDILGEYGNIPIKEAYSKDTSTVSSIVTDALLNIPLYEQRR